MHISKICLVPLSPTIHEKGSEPTWLSMATFLGMLGNKNAGASVFHYSQTIAIRPRGNKTSNALAKDTNAMSIKS